jgi:hypothetical protein
MGGGGAQRPVLCVNELKKTGPRSARARMRGQNPLVIYSDLLPSETFCSNFCVRRPQPSSANEYIVAC